MSVTLHIILSLCNCIQIYLAITMPLYSTVTDVLIYHKA